MIALVINRYRKIEITTSKLKLNRRSRKLKESKSILKGPYNKKRMIESEPSAKAKLNLFIGFLN